MSQVFNKRCDTCNIVIKYRTYWTKHCRTKKHLKNLGTFGGTSEYIRNDPVMTRNIPDHTRNIPDHTRNIPDHTRNIPGTYPVESKDVYGRCKYCNNPFKTQPGLSRHENHRCKQRPQQTQIVNNTNNSNNINTTNSHNNTTNSHSHSHSHNTLNNTLNNTNNQITLNVYGEETIKKNFLTNDLFKKLEGYNGDLSKIYLMLNEELYLKEKKNNNIKYTNIQSEYCQILSKNNNWVLKRLLEVMNERGIVVKNELEKELGRIIKEEGIKTNTIFPDPKLKKLQIMYSPLSKFEDDIEEIDEEDDNIKELYKKYQIELYNLKKKRKKKKFNN